MGLEQFERKIESLVESVFARASKKGVEPVEMGRRMIREMERSRRLGMGSEIVPNRFSLHISMEDADQLSTIINSVRQELLRLISDTASGDGYRFVGPLDVQIEADESLKLGNFYVEASFLEEPDFEERMLLVIPGGKKVTVSEGVMVIGRMPGCSIVIDDPRVSRKHAEIVRRDLQAFVRDLGSTNGTYLNGERLVGEVPLSSGDQMTFGATRLVFVIE